MRERVSLYLADLLRMRFELAEKLLSVEPNFQLEEFESYPELRNQE
jgi:hypothetical protein